MLDKTDSSGEHNSIVADFGNALVNSAIQNPLNSLSQIGSDLTGFKLPEIHLCDPDANATGANKFAQQLGGAVGMIVPFLLSKQAVTSARELAGIKLGTSAVAAGLEQGAIGGFMGVALTPTVPGENQFTGRLRNGIVDAGTFGVMGATNAKLTERFGGTAELPLASRIVKGSLLGSISGLPGGFANAELSSISSGNGPASLGDVAGEMGSFAALGGLIGGVDAWRGGGRETVKPSEIEKRFPSYTSDQLQSGRAVVSDELSQVKASSTDGQSLSVLDKLNQSPLEASQKDRILNSLFSIRENYTTFRSPDGKMDGDQEKNWIHTMGEFGRVLDSARESHLTPQQTEDAALASMFSDAVKTKANFMVHHLDGSKAAETFLTSQADAQFGADRVNGIAQAIKEHQIGPPGFMSMIYSNNIRAQINLERGKEFDTLNSTPDTERTSSQSARLAELKGTSDAFDARAALMKTPEAQAQMAELSARQMNGRYVTDAEADSIASLGKKIASPLESPVTKSDAGGAVLALTDAERALLKRTGNSDWYVPNESSPWYDVSRSLINADSIDNYATPGGFSKLVGLNGPETDIFFRDKNIDATLDSPRRSFKQAYPIMTSEGQALADAELAKTEAAITRAKGRTQDWLIADRGLNGTAELPAIPYWNADLKYPDRGPSESEWWRVHKIAATNRTPTEQQFWDDNRYTGLTAQEIQDFQYAAKIRDKMVDELRREQRVKGDLPPEFRPLTASN